MVALRLAAAHPDQVESLILSGVQVKAPRAFVAVQTFVMRLIPAGKYSSGDSGVTKAAVMGAMRELARADLRPDLARVTARTLVMCGAKDRVNLAAAREAAAGIAGAELRIVPGAGHVLNREKPELFTGTVIDWTTSAEG
jgi:pimeloyl-ACP methyl ester carboxylesterase